MEFEFIACLVGINRTSTNNHKQQVKLSRVLT